MNDVTALHVSYDGSYWLAEDGQGNIVPLQADEWLPDLPENSHVHSLILPIEKLLVRSFTLPLPHPRLIDAGMLGQELRERSDENPADWWLVWQAEKVADDAGGVSGMMFGMPEEWRQAIEADERWRQVGLLTVDAWVRLTPHAQARADDSSGVLAVFDADSEGVFVGLWQASADQSGLWRGMRRLNRSAWPGHDEAMLAEECMRTLMAMGWLPDQHAATGRLDTGLLKAMRFDHWLGDDAGSSDALPSRLQVQTDVSAAGLNFRHGHWALRRGLGWLKPWKRALSLAAAMAVIWVLAGLYHIHQLENQAEAYRQQIVQAFHTGLPNETVLIDPLAQLQRAAGGSSASSGELPVWLNQLAAVNRVFQTTPWYMQSIEWRDGVTILAGKAKSLDMLNRVRQALEKETGKKVVLADTDLRGNEVSFRMQWQ